MFGLNKIIPVDSDYKFLNLRKNFYIVSGIAIFLSLILLFFKGLNLGIDFKVFSFPRYRVFSAMPARRTTPPPTRYSMG